MQICRTALIVMLVGALCVSFGGNGIAADSSFVQTQRLAANDKATEDLLGASIAASGDTVLMGAPGEDTGGASSGAVYVFVRDLAEQWRQNQKIMASDNTAGLFFGSSVAVLDNVAFIGARGERSQGEFAGAVYVFVRNAEGVWIETQKLTASDGEAGRLFGYSIALRSNLAVIGARGSGADDFPGAAYVFMRSQDGLWQESQKLTPEPSSEKDEFGCSVAANSSAILVGACGDNERGILAGAAYFFALNTEGRWQKLQKLTASDSTGGEEFGASVAIDETIAVVGARFGSGEEKNSGAVYIFATGLSPIGVLWSETQKLTARDGATNDVFGASVAIVSDRIAIGAPEADEKGSDAGAVYFFALESGEDNRRLWQEAQKLTARDGAGGDQFGQSLALSETAAYVVSPFDDTTETDDDGTSTTFTNAGSWYAIARTSLPTTCESKMDYITDQCAGTFTVLTLTDLDQYVSDDYGRKDNNDKYKNLEIGGNLDYTNLILASPCRITVQSGMRLTGDFVSLDGRKGVVSKYGYVIDADKACVLSEQDRASLGNGAVVNADALTIRAAKSAEIGEDATIDVNGDLLIESTGDSDASRALIGSDAVISAGSLRLTSQQNVILGEDTTVAVDGAIFLISTGATSNSQAAIGDEATIQATDLTISAPRAARIGKKATVNLSGQLTMESTGASSDSNAIIAKSAAVEVGGNAELEASNSSILDKKTVVIVTGDFHMQAGVPEKCKIKKGVTLAAGSLSGNCF